MLLGGARREADAAAARCTAARRRTELARARLGTAKRRFLGNPVNLLLPFTAGLLGGALALYRSPRETRAGATAGARSGRPPERVSLRTLVTLASTLWSVTAALRESLAEGRFEPPPGPSEPPAPVTAEMPPPPPRAA